LNDNELREALAEYAHEAWSGWMRYMFSKSPANLDGSVFIPSELARRWKRQMKTPYSELPDTEKASDREQADRILTIIDPGAQS